MASLLYTALAMMPMAPFLVSNMAKLRWELRLMLSMHRLILLVLGFQQGSNTLRTPPLPDEAFIIGAEDGAALLGSTVMIYDKKAWHVAEIIEQVKGTRHKHNFTIMHEDESVQNVLLDPNLHGTEEGQNAWVWLEHHVSAEALSNEMVAVDPCDYAIPVGFKAQLNPPPAAALEPKGSAGVQLLQRKIMMRWEKYGWCKGDHILSPHIIIIYYHCAIISSYHYCITVSLYYCIIIL